MGLLKYAKIQKTEKRKKQYLQIQITMKLFQRDTEILPVNIRMKEIRNRFAIRAIRAVSPRNPVWKLANSSKLAKGEIEKLFARVKQMNGVDDDKYWRKRPQWKQSNYIRSMKSKKSLAKAEKQFACLLRVTNGNQIMTHQVKSVTITLSSRESCMEESIQIY